MYPLTKNTLRLGFVWYMIWGFKDVLLHRFPNILAMKSKFDYSEKPILKLNIDFESFAKNKVLTQQLHVDLKENQATTFHEIECQNTLFEGSILFRNLENHCSIQALRLDSKQDFLLNFQTENAIVLFEIFNSRNKNYHQKGIKQILGDDFIELNAHSEVKIIVLEGLNFKEKFNLTLPLNYSIYKEFTAIFVQNSNDFCYKISLTKHIYRLIFLLNEQIERAANPVNLSQMDLNNLMKLEYFITNSEDFKKADFSIQHWAEEANMCPTKFKKAFRNVFGKSPYQYFQHHRMDVAHKLITQKKLTVSETAYQTGYNSIGRFSMAFQEHFGVMPSKIK